MRHWIPLRYAEVDGFDVTASDGAPHMLAQARENALRFGIDELRFVEAEWTRLGEFFAGEHFDAVICLGKCLYSPV